MASASGSCYSLFTLQKSNAELLPSPNGKYFYVLAVCVLAKRLGEAVRTRTFHVYRDFPRKKKNCIQKCMYVLFMELYSRTYIQTTFGV